MKSYLHIDGDVKILKGDEARDAIQSENDRRYVSDNQGILSVPIERWSLAQKAEKKHWMEYGRNALNDRNDIHLSCFEEYTSVSGQSFRHAIELGCGPFTNLRFIGTKCSISKCDLLDPLIDDYLLHPHCRYDKHYLRTERTSKNYLDKMVNILNIITKRNANKIAIDTLYSTPIEKFNVEKKYDLLVINNVIEHCYDVNKVFQVIDTILEKNGVLIFTDKCYTHEKVKADLDVVYDAAHPLRVDRSVFDSFLGSKFNELFSSIISEEVSVAGMNMKFENLYFIGRKK